MCQCWSVLALILLRWPIDVDRLYHGTFSIIRLLTYSITRARCRHETLVCQAWRTAGRSSSARRRASPPWWPAPFHPPRTRTPSFTSSTLTGSRTTVLAARINWLIVTFLIDRFTWLFEYCSVILYFFVPSIVQGLLPLDFFYNCKRLVLVIYYLFYFFILSPDIQYSSGNRSQMKEEKQSIKIICTCILLLSDNSVEPLKQYFNFFL